ncbi:hypothetical protein FLX27_13445 [Agrobacterium tumefaciens]|nr:hypothetical protein [Agrobacterium tumefaciens]TQN61066.1 hypothetical protein FLX27_13445 [Agrobacterium tumefaciens]
MGAHHVIDHPDVLAAHISALGTARPPFVSSTKQTAPHAAEIAELVAPQGLFGMIDGPKGIDIMLSNCKAASIHHETMFTGGINQTPDMDEHSPEDIRLPRHARDCGPRTWPNTVPHPP